MEMNPAQTEAEIEARIDKWHEEDHPVELWQFLGWTREEYGHWVEVGEIPSYTPKLPEAECESENGVVHLTTSEANSIADALLSGRFALTEVERSAPKGSLEHASAVNTGK